MSQDSDDELDLLFQALADRTRRRILELAAEKAVVVGELASQFEMSAPAVTKHLNVLERAGLLTRTKQGRMRICRMNPEPLGKVSDVVAHYKQFWTHGLDRLEDFLEDVKKDES